MKTLKFKVNTCSSFFHDSMLLYMNYKDRVLALCPEFKNDILSEGSKYVGYLSYLTAFSLIMQSHDISHIAKAILSIAVAKSLVPSVKEEANKR